MLVLSTQQLLVTSTMVEQIGSKVEITRGIDEAMKLALKSHNVTFTKEQDRKLARAWAHTHICHFCVGSLRYCIVALNLERVVVQIEGFALFSASVSRFPRKL